MKTNKSGKISVSAKRTYSGLIDSLKNLLAEKPFEKITTMDICKDANVPRATFYNHFNDKYDLLEYTWKCVAKQIKLNVSPICDDRTYTYKLIYELLNFLEENKSLVKKSIVINNENVHCIQLKYIIKEIISDIVTADALSGKVYNVDLNLICEFYANAIVYTIMDWIEGGMKTKKEVLANSIAELIYK